MTERHTHRGSETLAPTVAVASNPGRDPQRVRALVDAIHAAVRESPSDRRGHSERPWRLMEVCGGQTHSIVRYGLDTLLPPGIELLHGPGCPVCVTPAAKIDRAHRLARTPGVTLCSFGDMLRVPGAHGDLHSARARGGDVRVVYSPLDALALAQAHPERHVVFFAVGFETTAPATALCVQRARRLGLENFSLLVAHVRVPPALEAILGPRHAADSPTRTRPVDAILAAGHVCTVMGIEEYTHLSQALEVPIVVTGFEPVDLLQGILLCVRQLAEGRAEVENAYARAVQPAGNAAARACVAEVFEAERADWRGFGSLEGGGLRMRAAYRAFDAERRFPDPGVTDAGPCAKSAGVSQLAGVCAAPSDAPLCPSDLVLRGELKPPECPAFAGACTPLHPLGAPMVSDEGACAAYYRYRRRAGRRRASVSDSSRSDASAADSGTDTGPDAAVEPTHVGS